MKYKTDHKIEGQRGDKDSNKDNRTKALESNPCGICRSMGLPICKGHGGGGGGGGGGDDESKDSNDSQDVTLHLNNRYNMEKQSLSCFLTEEDFWQESLDEDLLYHFDSALSSVAISLDLSKGLIIFAGQSSLDKDEQSDLDALYQEIERELKTFTKELEAQNIAINATFSRENNNLTIQIPDIKQYDAFIKRLINHNLLPAHKIDYEPEKIVNKEPEQGISVYDEGTYKTPSPFDISRGPRPIND